MLWERSVSLLLRSSPHRLAVLLDSLMPSGGGKRVFPVVSRDAALSTRHTHVLLTARTRLALPVLETAKTLPMPVVRIPFALKALLVTVAEAQQHGEAGLMSR